MTTGITCPDCKRPVCPSCKGDITQAGLTGCPYCETVRLDESSSSVKKALQEIYTQKLAERKQRIEKQVSGQDKETPWMMTSHSMQPVETATSWSASHSSSEPLLPGTPVIQDDQYPYRVVEWDQKDPIAEPVDKPKKKKSVFDKPKVTIESQIGKGGFVSGGWGQRGDMNHVITEEREVTPEEAARLERSGTTFPIISVKVQHLANGRAFVKEKRWATDAEVDKVSKGMKGIPPLPEPAGFDQLMKPLGLEDKLYPHQKQWIEDMGKPTKTPEDVKEEAYRGTGRTTVHCKAALNHIKYAIRKGIKADVLYLTENRRIATYCQKTFIALSNKDGFNHTHRAHGVVNFVNNRQVHFASVQNAWVSSRGRHFTLVIADMSEQSLKKYEKDINTFMATRMVNHEQPIYVAKTVSGKQHVKKIMRKMEHFEAKEGVSREILPSEEWDASWFPLSRKEKPPVSATREWAKPSQSLTTTIGKDINLGWSIMAAVLTIVLGLALVLIFF